MAFWAIFKGLGQLSYLLLGFKYSYPKIVASDFRAVLQQGLGLRFEVVHCDIFKGSCRDAPR